MSWNPNCIVGAAVLAGKIKPEEVTPCIGDNYYATVTGGGKDRSLQHSICYKGIPNYGEPAGHGEKAVDKVEKFFSDQELKPFIQSGGGRAKLQELDVKNN